MLFLLQEACKFLTNPNGSDIELVNAVHAAVSVYQNYTGQKKCFDIRADTSPDLGTSGWNFQVRNACFYHIFYCCFCFISRKHQLVNGFYRLCEWLQGLVGLEVMGGVG